MKPCPFSYKVKIYKILSLYICICYCCRCLLAEPYQNICELIQCYKVFTVLVFIQAVVRGLQH